MGNFSISVAQIVGLWMETLFMGFYLVSCGFALRAFLWDNDGSLKRRSEINWALFITATCLCIVAVFNVALGLLHNIQAFILYKGPGGSDQEFTNTSDWVNVTKNVTVLIQIILGGGVLIYRCWIMYSKSLIIVILPLIILLGNTIITIIIIYRELTPQTKVPVEPSSTKTLFYVFYVASTVLNILTTTMIIARIWWIEHKNSQFAYYTGSTEGLPMLSRKNRLGKAMRIIIESGLIITLTSLIYVVGTNPAYATSDVVVQNIGIAFNLIIIRTREQRLDEYTLHPTNTLPISARSTAGGNQYLDQRTSLSDSRLDRGRGGPRQHVHFEVDHVLHEGDLIRHIDSRRGLGHGGDTVRPGITRGRLSLQLRRRADPDTPDELVARSSRRTTSTPASPEAGARASGRGVEYVQQPESADLDTGVWVSGAAATSSPRLSLIKLGTERPGHGPTLPGPLHSAPLSAYRQTHRPNSSVGASTRTGGSQPSTVYTDSMYPESTLPSYPGTIRSVSPPGYSYLSRTRSERTAGVGGSDRGVSVYTESVGHGGLTAGLENLGEWRGDA